MINVIRTFEEGERKKSKSKVNIFFWEPLSPWNLGIVFELSRKKKEKGNERKLSFLKLFRNFSTSLFVFFLSNEIYFVHIRIEFPEKNDRTVEWNPRKIPVWIDIYNKAIVIKKRKERNIDEFSGRYRKSNRLQQIRANNLRIELWLWVRNCFICLLLTFSTIFGANISMSR